MSERRSSRAKKDIKYSAFDDLSDDDFADTTPPPPKKSKQSARKDSTKEDDVSVGQTIADVNVSNSGRKKRTPLAEKVYERELQQALEISLIQSQSSQDEAKSSGRSDHDQPDEQSLPPPKPCADVEKSKTHKSPQVNSLPTIVVDEKIELLEEVKENTSGRPRRTNERQAKQKATSSKGRKKVESDDEDNFSSEDDEDSEDDEGEGESEDDDDSDFGYESKPTSKKKVPAKKGSEGPKPSKPPKSSQKETTRGNAKKPVPSATRPSPKAAVPAKAPIVASVPKAAPVKKTGPPPPSRSPSMASSCIPSSLKSSWKPPAPAGSTSSSPSPSSVPGMRSPSSGLRLGLSRNQRIKPLHPSVHTTG